ncbi:hypothetical protein V6N13_064131 [Hibiscus sabdariffa]
MERSGHSICNAIDTNSWPPFRLAHNGFPISHLVILSYMLKWTYDKMSLYDLFSPSLVHILAIERIAAQDGFEFGPSLPISSARFTLYNHDSRDGFLWKDIGIVVAVNLEEESGQPCLDSSHRWCFFNWLSKWRVDSNISVEVECVPHALIL